MKNIVTQLRHAPMMIWHVLGMNRCADSATKAARMSFKCTGARFHGFLLCFDDDRDEEDVVYIPYLELSSARRQHLVPCALSGTVPMHHTTADSCRRAEATSERGM